MTEQTRLPVGALYQHCDLDGLDFETTADLAEQSAILGQDRALDALRFGVGIQQSGFNLYVLGPPGLGKLTVVRQYLEDKAAEGPAPDDWCYVNNFDDANRPRVLRLPNGMGAQLRQDMQQFVEDLLTAVPAAFESDEYQARIKEIEQEFHERQEQAFSQLKDRAEKEQIALLHTPGGFAFAPMRDGEVISPDDYQKLRESEQQRIEQLVAELQEQLRAILRQVPQWRKETRARVKQLNRDTAMVVVSHEVDELRERYKQQEDVLSCLDAVEKDVVEHVDDFRHEEEGENPLLSALGTARQPSYRRYQVNVLVGHTDSGQAPIIYEDNPTHSNLVGRVEHQAQMGALLTDFTMIKPGALHRANGGYLILDARKVLIQPYAWEALKRALQSREIRIQSLGEMLSLISTVSLEPEPIALDVKVVLMGERLLYYLLCEYDPEFAELFKVAADFDDRMRRDAQSTQLYARLIGTLVRKADLKPFDRGAVARVIERSARMVGDARKLSAHMGQITDLLHEANHWAAQNGHDLVRRDDVQRAIDEQIHRSDRIRERVHEEIHRGTVLIDVSGARVGQVNGLSVMQLGTFMFGQPSRISATVRMGEGDVVDIEREVELGGPIHSKAVMILSSYLGARYAMSKPLSLRASLVFEQSYGVIEGDSASVAELCALLSAAGEVPVKQSLAVTGSINQHGDVQAIGGVNEKIEGFFDVCKARGLSGEQGVIIPESNVEHLMLREDVVEAVDRGEFHVFAVKTVEQAVELLTGLRAGERDEQGEYTEGSLNRRVEDRLLTFAELRHEFRETQKAKDEEDDAEGDEGQH